MFVSCSPQCLAFFRIVLELKKKKERKKVSLFITFPCGTNLSLAAEHLRIPFLLLEKSVRLECVC